MASGGDDVSEGEWTRQHLGGNKARDVRHICHHVSVDLVANFSDALVINQAAVSTGSGNDDLGSVDGGQLFKVIVIDIAGTLIQLVRQSFKIL